MNLEKIAEIVLTPGVLLFVFFMFNKRIDDLARSINGVDARLKELNNNFIKHLETHATQDNPQ